MSIEKRGNVWYIRFVPPQGKRISVSAGTSDRQTALELEADMKRRAWRDAKLGEKLTKTWEDACLRWFDEKAEKSSLNDDRSRCKWLTKHLSGFYLSDISSDLIQSLGELKSKEASKSTANRHLQLLRAILRRAETDWNWLDRAPKVTLYTETKRRIRWITQEQARTLLAELPIHQRALAIIALCTGQRQGNILNLKWSQVNFDARTITLHGDQTKNGKPLGVPLNDMVLALLNELKGVHPEFVVTYKGHPVKQASTKAWYKALKRAGITNFRWHDLRHTWASWHIQAGTPLNDLQELGGWEDSTMVRKYAHMDVSHLQKHANKTSF
jgi:integrase